MLSTSTFGILWKPAKSKEEASFGIGWSKSSVLSWVGLTS